MRSLNTQQLQKVIDQKEDFTLINVLPVESFEEGHIPRSYSVPHEQDAFKS